VLPINITLLPAAVAVAVTGFKRLGLTPVPPLRVEGSNMTTSDAVTISRPIRRPSQSRLDLDHYLEALVRKPGALPGSTALEQARSAGRFTPVHDAWWAAVRKAHGDAAGTRALIEVLLLHGECLGVPAGQAAGLQRGAVVPPVLRRAASSSWFSHIS
jgi:hypothetical protein